MTAQHEPRCNDNCPFSEADFGRLEQKVDDIRGWVFGSNGAEHRLRAIEANQAKIIAGAIVAATFVGVVIQLLVKLL